MKSAKISLRGMVYASMFAALTAVGAYIAIPLQPVPITLQTLFTNLAGALLGGYLGALSQLVYVVLGVMGLPVFAGGKAGLGVLLGPTGGYLVGFIAGTYFMGRMIERREQAGFGWILLALGVGHVVIYGLGALQLSVVAHLSAAKALAVGVLPFLPGDILKILVAAFLTPKLRDRIKL